MAAYERYVRTEGPTVLDGLAPEEKDRTAKTILHAAWVKYLLDQGGTLVIAGLGRPDDVKPLLDYEIRMRGLGNGQIELSLSKKHEPEATA